jgi:hypothetical protein
MLTSRGARRSEGTEGTDGTRTEGNKPAHSTSSRQFQGE